MANSTPQQDALVRRAAILKSHAERLLDMATDYQQGMVSARQAASLMTDELADAADMFSDIKQMIRDLKEPEKVIQEAA